MQQGKSQLRNTIKDNLESYLMKQLMGSLRRVDEQCRRSAIPQHGEVAMFSSEGLTSFLGVNVQFVYRPGVANNRQRRWA